MPSLTPAWCALVRGSGLCAPLAAARPACRATAPGALWSSALHLLAPVAEGVF